MEEDGVEQTFGFGFGALHHCFEPFLMGQEQVVAGGVYAANGDGVPKLHYRP